MFGWIKLTLRLDGAPLYLNARTKELALEDLQLARLVPVPAHLEGELLSLALQEAAAVGRGCSHTG